LFFAGTMIYGIAINARADNLNDIIKSKGYKDNSQFYLVIDKKHYTLDLFYDSLHVKSFRAVFGRSNTIDKLLGIKKTVPEGIYTICASEKKSKYEKFLKLNFPRKEDIAKLYEKKFLTKEEFEKYLDSKSEDECFSEGKLANIKLGIQGTGEMDFLLKNIPFVYNWTNGSIAISNDGINEIYSVIKIGSKVVVKE